MNKYPASEGDSGGFCEAWIRFGWAAVKWGAAAFGFLVLGLMCAAVVFADTPPQLPPTYVSGVVTYDVEGHFAKLVTGSTRFLSCREALDDTMSALAKFAEYAPKGSIAEGVCIPVHTHSPADLVK